MRMFNRQCVVSGYWLTAERKFHNERMILKICSDGPHCIQTWSSITFNPALPLLFLVISVFYKRQTSKSLSSSSLWHTVYGCWGPSLRSRMHYMLHQWSYSYWHTWGTEEISGETNSPTWHTKDTKAEMGQEPRCPHYNGPGMALAEKHGFGRPTSTYLRLPKMLCTTVSQYILHSWHHVWCQLPFPPINPYRVFIIGKSVLCKSE